MEKDNKGIRILIICGVIAMLIIIGCIFFSDEIFGIFLK